MLVVGPNGAGKTNLLESLHVATQGFSPRTRADANLIRFGEERSRIAVRGRRGSVPVDTDVVLRRAGGKQVRLNGARLDRPDRLRAELATLVFTPDRLTVVKGSPAARRAYFDRALGRLLPARAQLPVAYAEALGQRNAALRRVRLELAPRGIVAPWTAQLAELGRELVSARREALSLLVPAFVEHASRLGLAAASLGYLGDPPSTADLEARLDRDVERGLTGLGPHLDDVAITAAGRELRSFGSQGEQRLAVLSLLLAEASVLVARGAPPPLLLLDDVLSELDRDRREALAGLIATGGQTVITTTSRRALPVEPDQVIEVSPGEARPV